jgi:hypothetical protein
MKNLGQNLNKVIHRLMDGKERVVNCSSLMHREASAMNFTYRLVTTVAAVITLLVV